jgi:hypothetical protein
MGCEPVEAPERSPRYDRRCRRNCPRGMDAAPKQFNDERGVVGYQAAHPPHLGREEVHCDQRRPVHLAQTSSTR